MIIVRIIGGLGNQMFQYAFGLALAKKNNTCLVIDANDFANYRLRSFKLDKFPVSLQYTTSKQNAIFRIDWQANFFARLTGKINKFFFGYKYIKEPFLHYWRGYKKIKNNSYVDGFWQSESYFLDIRTELLYSFHYNKFTPAALNYLEKIKSSNAAFIHIRRGDYVTNKDAAKVHGVCSDEYYLMAIEQLEKKNKDLLYFIFSDDIFYVKEHMLKGITNKIFIEWEEMNENCDLQELALMSHCKHAIIANSSFSWWGAWLIQYEDKQVVAPAKWFADQSIKMEGRIPASWIKI